MLNIGDIREWSDGTIGVVVGIQADVYLVVTESGNEVPMHFSIPSKIVRLNQNLRNDLMDINKAYSEITREKKRIANSEVVIKHNEDSIYNIRLRLNYDYRKKMGC